MRREEFLGARLYTGPLYLKYNAVLVSHPRSSFPFRLTTHVCCVGIVTQRGLQFAYARPTFERLCKGNMYTTTLHAINSAIIKLSKLTSAGKVYRGVSGGLLPESCRKFNAHGIKGGVEGGFMSTTFDRDSK